jgi:RNA polymerase sigma-70 factor (ECF subfamily)
LKVVHFDSEFDLSSIPDMKGERANNAQFHYEQQLESGLIHKALQQLPFESREILILREYDDLSYQMIADVLNCPVGTVMSRLARARLKLRELLSETRQPLVKKH